MGNTLPPLVRVPYTTIECVRTEERERGEVTDPIDHRIQTNPEPKERNERAPDPRPAGVLKGPGLPD